MKQRGRLSTGCIALVATLLAAGSGLVCAEDFIATETRLREIRQKQQALPPLRPSSQTCQRIGFHGHEADPAWVMIDLGQVVEPEQIVLFPARLTAEQNPPSPGFPSACEIAISPTDDFDDFVRIANWREEVAGDGEQLGLLSFSGNGAAGRYLKVTVTGFRENPEEPGQRYFRLGEIVVLAQGRNVALSCPVTSTASTESSRRWEQRNLTDGYFWCLPLRGVEPSRTSGYRSSTRTQGVVSGSEWIEIDLGAATPIDEIHLVPAHPRDSVDFPGFGFPSHFRVLVDTGTSRERMLLDETEPQWPAEALPNPGAAQVMFATPGVVARTVRISCEALWRRGPGSGQIPEEYLLALSELQVWKGGKNLAIGRPVRYGSSQDDPGWSPQALTDGKSSREELLDWPTWIAGIEQRRQWESEARRIEITLQERREVMRQRIVWGALVMTGLVGLSAAMIVFWLRHRSMQTRHALQARIARDLHDEIGASLSHLAIQSDLARQLLDKGSLDPERLETIAKDARETLGAMRDVIWMLAPVPCQWNELALRLQSICQRLLEGVSHHILVEGTPPMGQIPIEMSQDLVAFVKESLTNARRHSGASQVNVTMAWGASLCLAVTDNGRGFDVAQARQADGSGLHNLEQRAHSLAAKLDIQSQPGQGTQVRLTLPLSTS